MIGRSLFAGCAALLVTACSSADATADNPDFTCKLSHPAKDVTSLAKLPATIRTYLKEKAGAMADRGEFFNAGDAITKPAPFNRFIRGGESAGHWFVWYEHGGFAYWKQILIFKLDAKGAPHANAEAHGGKDLCAQTDALLDSAAKVGL